MARAAAGRAPNCCGSICVCRLPPPRAKAGRAPRGAGSRRGAPALGPLEEGRRLARLGQREGSEPVLARSTYALWSILNPLFTRELGRVKEQMLHDRDAGEDVGPGVAELRDLALTLRRRNFAAAIAAYRRLRTFADSHHAGASNFPPEPRPMASRR